MRAKLSSRLKSRKLLRRWQRRKAKLLLSLPVLLDRSSVQGNVEAIHELRVAIRRLRLYVRLGRPLLRNTAVSAFLSWARSVSKATSSVRDLDVALEWLQAQENTDEVIELCQTRRARTWRAAQPRLSPPKRGLCRALLKVKGDGRPHVRLARRLAKIEDRLAKGIRRGVPWFFDAREEEQHQLRRLTRWWRYLNEVGLPRREQRKDRLLNALVQAQEALGDRQNLLLADAALCQLRRPALTKDLRRKLAADQVATSARIRVCLAALARLSGAKR
jgi:CHAD domain-containing protein